MERLLLAVLILFAAASAHAQVPAKMPLCIQPDGRIYAKKKCARVDQQMAWDTIAPASSDWGCRTISVQALAGGGSHDTAAPTLMCADSEYMTLWGYSISPVRLVVLRWVDVSYTTDGLPRGVQLVIQGEVGSDWAGSDYTVTATATCCAK